MVMEEKVMSAGRGVVLLTALGVLSDALAFCYRVVMSRLAGAQVMGLYQLVIPVYSVLMSMTAVGFCSATANLSAQHLARRDRRSVHQTLMTCLRLFLLLLLPVGAAVILWSDFISTALLGDARTQLALILLVPCAALTGVENLHKHIFYGAGLVGTPAVVNLLEQLVRSVAVIALLVCFLPQWPERAVGLIIVGMVICEVFSSCTLSILYRRRFVGRGLDGPGEPSAVRRGRILSIALPVGLNSVLGNLLSAANAALIPRQLVAGGMSREGAVAQFGVLTGMTLPLLGIPTVFLGALTLVLAPRLAQATALGRSDQVRRLVSRAMSVVSILSLPALALMLVVGPELGSLLFRQEGVGFCMVPMAAVMAMSCFCSVLACTLNSTGHQRAVAVISLLGGAVQLALTALLVPLPGVGLEGYAAAAVISSILELTLCLWAVHRYISLSLRWFDWLTAPCLAAALSSLCANLLFRVLKDSGLLPVSAGLAALLFGVVLALAALQAQGVDLRGSLSLRQ